MIIFTNQDIGTITKITSKYKIEKQAKSGAISPIEVTLKAGPTGMDSSMIELFQALKIQTKVKLIFNAIKGYQESIRNYQ
jgi:large subunit ribosomal protein LP0